jgi:hypothetical protein
MKKLNNFFFNEIKVMAYTTQGKKVVRENFTNTSSSSSQNKLTGTTIGLLVLLVLAILFLVYMGYRYFLNKNTSGNE